MKESISAIKESLKQVTSIQDPLFDVLRQDERKGVRAAVTATEKRLLKEQAVHRRFLEMSLFEKEAEKAGFTCIAGIDEVGRGPLAGPVITAAVVLPSDFYLPGLDDSKKLSAQKKEDFYEYILANAISVGVGEASAREIDRHNIYEATKIAMLRAVDQLSVTPDHLLVDAMTLPVATEQQSLIKGDARSISIAAASVVAKVTRDRMMAHYHTEYPYYAFDRNAGYGTKDHLDGLARFGPCEQHRRSFEPVKSMAEGGER